MAVTKHLVHSLAVENERIIVIIVSLSVVIGHLGQILLDIKQLVISALVLST